ncbi:hypothetical protein RJ55_00816 [Drechmeria coniospora]|nr:hypothetical protein RJ55_00816 [Drechmeria coniospora]
MEHTVTESDVWASPSQDDHRDAHPKTPKTPMTPKTPAARDGRVEPVDRDEALRMELEGVRTINKSIEGVLATLGRTGGNMEVVSKTVANTSTLLNTWTRMLSQTEHNQRLVLNPSWQGATEDVVEQEAEALRKHREAERKAAEEEERREEVRRRREEGEARRRLGTSSSSRVSKVASGIRNVEQSWHIRHRKRGWVGQGTF